MFEIAAVTQTRLRPSIFEVLLLFVGRVFSFFSFFLFRFVVFPSRGERQSKELHAALLFITESF